MRSGAHQPVLVDSDVEHIALTHLVHTGKHGLKLRKVGKGVRPHAVELSIN